MANRRPLVKKPPAPPYHLLKPFVGTMAASLVFVAPQSVPKVSMGVVKVLPILCLIRVVLKKEVMSKEGARISLALVFSLIGDYYLVWPRTHFLQGIMAFTVAQSIYIASFGFKRVSWKSGAAAYGLDLFCLMFVLDFIRTPPEKIAAAFYSFTLTTVFWRAVDRAWLRKDVSWHRRMCGAAGTAIFCVSDLCYTVLQEGEKLPHLPAQLIILTTYYLAQVLIVLGLCEGFWKL